MSSVRARPKHWGKDKIGTLAPADVLGALDLLGVDVLYVRGGRAYTWCPYHPAILGREDRKPGSFSIDIETGLNRCWSCDGGGSFTRFVEAVTGMASDRAKRWVLRHGGTMITPKPQRRRRHPDDDPYAEPEKLRTEVTEASLALFGPPPADKLCERRLTAEAAEAYEVLWDGSGGWILPIRNPQGDLLGWQIKKPKRTLNHPRGVPKSATLFGLHRLGSRAIVVESPLDAARLLSAGIVGGVATYGASVSEAQARILLGCEEVVVAMDNDDAGRKTAKLLRDGVVQTVTEHGMSSSRLPCGGLMGRVQLSFINYAVAPHAKDPGDMTDEECRRAIAEAIPATETAGMF